MTEDEQAPASPGRPGSTPMQSADAVETAGALPARAVDDEQCDTDPRSNRDPRSRLKVPARASSAVPCAEARTAKEDAPCDQPSGCEKLGGGTAFGEGNQFRVDPVNREASSSRDSAGRGVVTDPLEEVRARLCRAMRHHGDDWLDRAEHLLDGEWRQRQRRTVYDVTSVGGRIRAAREALGLSQEQLAIRLGIKQVRVSEWERGKANLDATMFVRLAGALSRVTTRAWLLMETDEGAPNVPLDVLGKRHSREGYAWIQQKRAWKKAKDEAERRNAERLARREAEAQKR